MKDKENGETVVNDCPPSSNKDNAPISHETINNISENNQNNDNDHKHSDRNANVHAGSNVYNMEGTVYPYVKQRFPNASLRHSSISLLNHPGNISGVSERGGYNPYFKPCCCNCHASKDNCGSAGVSRNMNYLRQQTLEEDLFLDLLQADYENYLSLDRFFPKCAAYFRTSRMPDDYMPHGRYMDGERQRYYGQTHGMKRSHRRSKSEGNTAEHIMEKQDTLTPDSLQTKPTIKPKKISSKLQLTKKDSFRSVIVSSSKPCSPTPPEYQYVPRSTPKYVLCGFCNRVYSHRSMEIHSRQCKQRFVPRSKRNSFKKLSKKIESPSMMKLCEATRRKRSKSEGEIDKSLLDYRLLKVGKEAERALKRSLSKRRLAQNLLPSLNNEQNNLNNKENDGIDKNDNQNINRKKNSSEIDLRPTIKETLKRERRKTRPSTVTPTSTSLRPIKPRVLSATVTQNINGSVNEHLVPHPPLKYRKCNHCGKNYETKLKAQHMNKCVVLKRIRKMKRKEEKAEKENMTVAAPIVTAVRKSSNTTEENIPKSNDDAHAPPPPPQPLHPPEFQKCMRCGSMYGSQSLAIHEKQCTGPK